MEQTRKIKMNKSNSPKEIYVRVMKLTPTKNIDVDITQIKEEYDREVSGTKGWNIFSGGGIGASIGLVACLTSSVCGVPITSPELITIVCGSLLFGIIAGYILY